MLHSIVNRICDAYSNVSTISIKLLTVSKMTSFVICEDS